MVDCHRLVSAMTATLEAVYVVRPRGRIAEIEEILTMDPPPPEEIIAGMANLEIKNMVSTFTCMTLR